MNRALVGFVVGLGVAGALAAETRDLRSVEVVEYDCSSEIGRRRMTLFGNGTVRLQTWAGESPEPVMRLKELNPDELIGFVNRLREVDLSESEESRASPVGDWIQKCTLELDLHELAAGDGEDRGPTRFEFGPYDSVSLALSRVVAIADEMAVAAEEQALVGNFPVGYEPLPGDILERSDGALFEVVAFTSDQRGVELLGVDQPMVVYVLRDELIGEFISLVERR